MKLFRVYQEIDYSSPELTTSQMMAGLPGALFEVLDGQLLLTIDMIVDMGERALKMPHGMDQGVALDREARNTELNSMLEGID